MKILKKINEQIQKTKLDKIKMMELSKLKLDPTYKDVFNQEAKKVDRIAEDMIENGFDKSQPLIITEDYAILDGNSRFIAAQKAGIKIVPIIIKKFDTKNDALVYEYKLQLNRRNLNDSELFLSFLALEELHIKSGKKGRSDEILAKQLDKSPRFITKMKEVAKKASPQLLDKIKTGEISLHKAYMLIKENETFKTKQKKEPSPKTISKSIDFDSFRLGLLFILESMEDENTKNKLLKDSRIKYILKQKKNLLKSDLKQINACILKV